MTTTSDTYTDTALRYEGMRALVDGLGRVGAERFIALVIREPFDYTEWQSGLFEDMGVRELSAAAMEYRDRQSKRG
jgi:hypothetical protein